MYKPVWEGVIEGYAKNYSSKNLWRFNSIDYEYDELICEAYLVFRKCKKKYKGKDAPLFMNYFKQSLMNRFNTLTLRSFKLKENVVSGCVSEREDLIDVNSKFNELLMAAPKEVKDVVSLIFNSPRELLKAVGFFKKKSRGFYNNKLLCELLGYDERHWDLSKSVQEYFYE